MKKIFVALCVGLALLSQGCKQAAQDAAAPATLDVNALPKASPEQVEQLVAQFIEAKEGSTIEVPAGYYEMNTQLILDKVNNVTIKGAGMYRTVFSFKGLKAGGEGMKIVGNKLTLQDFTVMDAPGDCIKTQHCDGITFRNINATWSNTDLSKSGTYGIYPVQCKGVLVEGCEVSHSRDAGVYVGQSENIIVRKCYVFENVAGIEIENCDNAEVYDNRAENNTAGVLVFNLPMLQKAMGSRTRVYNNLIKDNNHVNFAEVPTGATSGTPVSMVPPGSGVIILAGNEVEIFNNKILQHKTAGVSIASYHFTGLPIPEHPGWSPYTTNIYVHDNEMTRPVGMMPDTTKQLGRIITLMCQETQDVVYDGVFDLAKMKTNPANPMNICIGQKQPGMVFSRMVPPADGNMANMKVLKDIETFNTCTVAVKTDVSAVGK